MATDLDIYRPFDAGAGSGVTEDGWRAMMRHLLPNGPIYLEDNELAVAAKASLACDVATGKLWIRGHYGENTSIKTIALAAVGGIPGGQSRYDRIIARLDPTTNKIQFDALTGTAAGSPTAPALTQSASGIWEETLALVGPLTNASTVTTGLVADERSITGSTRRGWQVIADQLLTADGTVSFTAIPQTFTHLKLLCSGRGNAAVNNAGGYIQLNGDGSASYDLEYLQASSSTVSAGPSSAGTSWLCAFAPGTTATADKAGHSEITILDYRSTTYHKNMVANAGYYDAAVGAFSNQYMGTWRKTDAINQIVLSFAAIGTGWKARSRFTLLGIR
jgi:hypothetical protein